MRFVKEGHRGGSGGGVGGGGQISPPETGPPIKVQITSMLSLMEQCGLSFAEVMIISASIVFSVCAQESSVNAAS